jgi:CRISPR-associated protein Cmr3
MTIEISPLDTLFFKNPKPFNAGDESWSDGIFPPTPSTIYGALRSIYFRNNPHELEKANTKDDPTKDLLIHKIYLEQNNNIYFPLPLDIVYKKGFKTHSYILQQDEKNIITNYKTDFILNLKGDEAIEIFENSFLTMGNFKKYQNSSNEKFRRFAEIKSIDEFIINEPKIGNKIDKKNKTVQDGYLYRVDFKRLIKNVKIVVEFSGLDIKNNQIMRLGGEGKIATINEIERVDINYPNINKKFKLYFLTPAIFDKGWLPKWIDKDSLEGEYKGLNLKLLTASIGKYKLIGGFDMKENRPKLMYRAVPEGSVYYFELLNGDKEKVIELLHNQAISDKLANEGYGITFIGEVK